MGFKVNGKEMNKEITYFNLGDNWKVQNVRVVSEHLVTFTLRLEGLALYNMRLVESTKKENEYFISNGQYKGSDGKYYNSYAIYLDAADSRKIIDAVMNELKLE